MPDIPAPLLDDFNRSDSTGLGANWTAGWSGGTAALNVVSNRALSQGSGYKSSYWNPSTFGPDTAVSATFLSGRMFLGFRLVNIGSGTTDGYEFDFNASGTHAHYRIDNDSGTQLGSNVSAALSASQVIGCTMVGNLISQYINGSVVATRTDSTYTGAGNVGLDGLVGAGIDDFGAGTIAAASAFTPRRALIGVGF